MANKQLNIIILAAGKGTRMRSSQPKVLHTIGGKPILGHVLDAAKALNPNKIIVIYGFGGEKVKAAFSHEEVLWVEQKEQLGTGHAVQQAIPHLDADGNTLILLGDVPLINAEKCQQLINKADEQLALLTFIKTDPTGYGRIVRNAESGVMAIVEHKDATDAQHQILEVNTGIMAMPNVELINWLKQLTNDNAQGEYYLTDIVAMSVAENQPVTAEITNDEQSVTGINSKPDLVNIEREYQQRLAKTLLQDGVTLKDHHRIDIRGALSCEQDVVIDVNCIFEGQVHLGEGVTIGPNCVIKNTRIERGVKVAAFSHLEDAIVGAESKVGPYARLRPGAQLANKTHIGNFVEIKNANIGEGSKVNHLSYIGDSEVGKSVNIGAGAITCNYDGANKFKTIIEDNVFVGSDTQLIAPVTIGKNATIAAGSTITRNVAEDTLTLCRAKEQKSIPGWARPKKIKK